MGLRRSSTSLSDKSRQRATHIDRKREMNDFKYDPLVCQAETARQRGCNIRTLLRERVAGTGIPYVRVGARQIAYRQSDINAWIEARRYISRADELNRRAA